MTTADALKALLDKTFLTQGELAQKLGVSAESISRYRHGREPARPILKKLAALAENSKLSELQEFFEGQWRARIAARLRNLQSPESERFVPVAELRRWQEGPRFVADQLKQAQRIYTSLFRKYATAVEPDDERAFVAANRILFGLIHNFLPERERDIEPYLTVIQHAPGARGDSKLKLPARTGRKFRD